MTLQMPMFILINNKHCMPVLNKKQINLIETMSRCVRGPFFYRKLIYTSRFSIFPIRNFSAESSPKSSSTIAPPRSVWKSSVNQTKLDRTKLYAQIRGDGNIDLSSVTIELPLYELTNRFFYRISFWFCVGQFAFWFVCAYWLYSFDQQLGRKDETKSKKTSQLATEKDSGFDRKVLNSLKKFVQDHSDYILPFFVVAGNVLAGTLMFMLTRCVSSIRLMPGGKQVKIGLLTPFGGVSSKRFVVHLLEDLSCKQHRLQRANFNMLYCRGQRIPYIIDSDGHFQNEKIYDHTVGMSRKLE